MTIIDKDQIEEPTTGILGQWYAVAKSVQVKRGQAARREGARAQSGAVARHARQAHIAWRTTARIAARRSRAARSTTTTSPAATTASRSTAPAPSCACRRCRAARSRAARPSTATRCSRRTTASSSTSRARSSPSRRELDAAGGVFRSGLEQHSVHGALGLQLSLRLRQLRRSHARLLSACGLVHARVRRQAGRDEGRASATTASTSRASSRRTSTSTGPTWCVDGTQVYCRLDIPYPEAAGPGGPFRIIGYTTPVDERSCLVFFWRFRQVSGHRARILALSLSRDAGGSATGTCWSRTARC